MAVEDEEDGWIEIEHKQKTKQTDLELEELQETPKKQKKGLFTKEEFQQLKEEAKLIEDTYKQRIKQIEDIHFAQKMSKGGLYEVKNAESVYNSKYIVAPPKIEYKEIEVQPKFLTRDEINALVDAKMPKQKITGEAADIFVEKSQPIIPQTTQQEQKIIKFKTKISLIKQQQKAKETIIYTDQPITFTVNKDTQKSFFSSQAELPINETGKELFGRVRRYRKPIVEKKVKENYQQKQVQYEEKDKLIQKGQSIPQIENQEVENITKTSNQPQQEIKEVIQTSQVSQKDSNQKKNNKKENIRDKQKNQGNQQNLYEIKKEQSNTKQNNQSKSKTQEIFLVKDQQNQNEQTQQSQQLQNNQIQEQKQNEGLHTQVISEPQVNNQKNEIQQELLSKENVNNEIILENQELQQLNTQSNNIQESEVFELQSAPQQLEFQEEEQINVEKSAPLGETKINIQQQIEISTNQLESQPQQITQQLQQETLYVEQQIIQPQFIEEENVNVEKGPEIYETQDKLHNFENNNQEQQLLQQPIFKDQEIEQQHNLKLEAPSPIDVKHILPTSVTNIIQNEFPQDLGESSFLADIEDKKKILPGYLDMTMNSRKKLLSKNIPVIYRTELGQEDILELETMSLILDGCKEVVVEEYISYLENVRKQRREFLKAKNYFEYIHTVMQMAEEQFKITQDGFSIIAQSLDIKEDVLQNSFVFYSQHDEYGQEFVEQLTFIQQNMKDIPPIKVVIRKPQGIEMIKYQILVIENYQSDEIFQPVFNEFKQNNEAAEALPIVLNTLIDDIIFQKFGYEEEDKIRFLKQYSNDKEIKQLKLQMESLVEHLFNVEISY